MASLAWDVIKVHPVVPGSTANSGSFAVPRGTETMTIFAPASVNSLTYTLQSLDPKDGTTWVQLSFVELTTGTVKTFPNVAASTCVVYLADMFGGGNLRIVKSATTDTADATFSVMFVRIP